MMKRDSYCSQQHVETIAAFKWNSCLALEARLFIKLVNVFAVSATMDESKITFMSSNGTLLRIK